MGMHSDNPAPDEQRTTMQEEAARRAANEREQAEHPERLAGRGRAASNAEEQREDEPDRLTPRRNEDISEG